MSSVIHGLVFLAIAALSAVLALALIPAARKIGLVDHPGERKVHETVTPLTGGPAIYITLLIFLAWKFLDHAFVQANGITHERIWDLGWNVLGQLEPLLVRALRKDLHGEVQRLLESEARGTESR